MTDLNRDKLVNSIIGHRREILVLEDEVERLKRERDEARRWARKYRMAFAMAWSSYWTIRSEKENP